MFFVPGDAGRLLHRQVLRRGVLHVDLAHHVAQRARPAPPATASVLPLRRAVAATRQPQPHVGRHPRQRRHARTSSARRRLEQRGRLGDRQPRPARVLPNAYDIDYAGGSVLTAGDGGHDPALDRRPRRSSTTTPTARSRRRTGVRSAWPTAPTARSAARTASWRSRRGRQRAPRRGQADRHDLRARDGDRRAAGHVHAQRRRHRRLRPQPRLDRVDRDLRKHGGASTRRRTRSRAAGFVTASGSRSPTTRATPARRRGRITVSTRRPAAGVRACRVSFTGPGNSLTREDRRQPGPHPGARDDQAAGRRRRCGRPARARSKLTVKKQAHDARHAQGEAQAQGREVPVRQDDLHQAQQGRPADHDQPPAEGQLRRQRRPRGPARRPRRSVIKQLAPLRRTRAGTARRPGPRTAVTLSCGHVRGDRPWP